MKRTLLAVGIAVLALMMLASCESIPSAFNPFAPDETATTSTSDPPVTGQTERIPGVDAKTKSSLRELAWSQARPTLNQRCSCNPARSDALIHYTFPARSD